MDQKDPASSLWRMYSEPRGRPRSPRVVHVRDPVGVTTRSTCSCPTSKTPWTTSERAYAPGWRDDGRPGSRRYPGVQGPGNLSILTHRSQIGTLTQGSSPWSGRRLETIRRISCSSYALGPRSNSPCQLVTVPFGGVPFGFRDVLGTSLESQDC